MIPRLFKIAACQIRLPIVILLILSCLFILPDVVRDRVKETIMKNKMDVFKRGSVVLATQEPNVIQSMSLRHSKSREVLPTKIETSFLNDVVATTADIPITTKVRTQSTSLPDVVTSSGKTCTKGSKLGKSLELCYPKCFLV